ncbi:hypothetical protein AJ78_06944 [Emergomyces pasteurianus Ep9510]|uniref:Uncharacterized protein n=1 Tax=Emergomyces pasteurianus Ep9510 TaxID=1447872 RepID=A0A1J9P759_9EURO|nr:hypothetical protein AJ78_06944 [Emergomyces pasteurianus Ep9510]
MLLPALLLGYLLPTLLLFQEYTDHRLADAMTILCHRTPPAGKPMADIPSLKAVYVSSFCAAAFIHIFTLSPALSRYPNLTLAKIFVPYSINISGDLRFISVSERIRSLWLADYWVIWTATMAWCVLAVWDMNRVDRARVNLRVVFVIVVLGAVALGPGATIVAVWYWREEKMAKVLFRKDWRSPTK